MSRKAVTWGLVVGMLASMALWSCSPQPPSPTPGPNFRSTAEPLVATVIAKKTESAGRETWLIVGRGFLTAEVRALAVSGACRSIIRSLASLPPGTSLGLEDAWLYKESMEGPYPILMVMDLAFPVDSKVPLSVKERLFDAAWSLDPLEDICSQAVAHAAREEPIPADLILAFDREYERFQQAWQAGRTELTATLAENGVSVADLRVETSSTGPATSGR